MLRRLRIRVILEMVLAVVLAVQLGCATRQDVADIVNQSNRNLIDTVEAANSTVVMATVAENTPDINLENRGLASTEWQQTATKIEIFIADHPDMPRTTNALRVRQAILYLSADQRNLAVQAFRAVDTAQLSSARDRAIVDVHETLVWWYSITGPTMHAFSDADRQKAQQGLQQLAKESAGLADSRSAQRLLGQMRVRIANRLARSLANPADIKATLNDGLTQYAAQFDASEHVLIQTWHLQKTGSEVTIPASELRWYDYVPKAFQDAEDMSETPREHSGASGLYARLGRLHSARIVSLTRAIDILEGVSCRVTV